jgi:hypothetical protein
MSNSTILYKENEYINIITPKKNCKRPTRQYGITKYEEKNI